MKDVDSMNTKLLVNTAFFITLGLVLPLAFHFIGGGGPLFLPMHIPVLLVGALLGPVAGLITGIITPILSSLLTGMPPVLPVLPIMVVELALYGLVTAYLVQKSNIYVSLLVSMLVGRVGAGLVVTVMVHIFNFKLPANPLVYIWGTITTGLPGIIIQLVFIPILYKTLINFNGLSKEKINV